jgi:hypothetical protein
MYLLLAMSVLQRADFLVHLRQLRPDIWGDCPNAKVRAGVGCVPTKSHPWGPRRGCHARRSCACSASRWLRLIHQQRELVIL